MNRRIFKTKMVFVVFCTVFACAGFMPLAAQDTSVDEAYLRESVPMMVIREQAASQDREGKNIALDYIREAMDNGDDTRGLLPVLQDLALEGILNKTRSEGRVANNYADVRLRAVAYMGEIATKESADALMKVALVEEEPAVITEAFRALSKIDGKIDANKSDGRMLDVANWIFNQINAMGPDNRLALAYLDAVEQMAVKMPQGKDGSRNPAASDEEKKFWRINLDTTDKVRSIASNYRYITGVREKAKKVLSALAKTRSS